MLEANDLPRPKCCKFSKIFNKEQCQCNFFLKNALKLADVTQGATSNILRLLDSVCPDFGEITTC